MAASALDPRLTPARADIAAKHLEGKVTAERFVEATLREVAEPQAPLRSAPRCDAPLDTEALMGEHVQVYETTEEGFAWGQLESDGYVGWLPANALRPPGPPATHKVAVPRTLVFPAASIKLPPLAALSFGSRLAVARIEEPFAVTASGGFIPIRHLSPIETVESDFVAVAERFVGAPYLWGGKTNLGLDCSALVQIALTACGMRCPRDSDLQENALGVRLSDVSSRRRGDLLFWRRHVAIARDEETLIHANAFHMAVAIEPITDAITRIHAGGSELTSVRRLAPPA